MRTDVQIELDWTLHTWSHNETELSQKVNRHLHGKNWQVRTVKSTANMSRMHMCVQQLAQCHMSGCKYTMVCIEKLATRIHLTAECAGHLCQACQLGAHPDIRYLIQLVFLVQEYQSLAKAALHWLASIVWYLYNPT